MAMKRMLLMVLAVVLATGTASATATVQKWTAGWDNFSVPLNYKTSHVRWSVNVTTHKLSVTFTLTGATPSNLYQVALNFFCSTFPATFGQFPNDQGGGACVSLTRQGVTATVAEVELGVVTTDIHGNGSFSVVIGPAASGTYSLEFFVRNGVGCDLIGGAACSPPDSSAVYQSPGPIFGDATTISIP
jgi:hypothetical protein